MTIDQADHLRKVLRSCDAMLQALLRSGSYDEARVVFWQMHAISRQLRPDRTDPKDG